MNAAAASSSKLEKNAYVKEYNEYVRLVDVILNEMNKSRIPSDQYVLKDQGKRVFAQFRNSITEFVKPEYQNYKQTLESIEAEKRALMFRYDFLKERVLFGPPMEKQVEHEEIVDLTKRINLLNDRKTKLNRLFEDTKLDLYKEEKKLGHLFNVLKTKRSDEYHAILSTMDDIVRDSLIKDYVKGYDEYTSKVMLDKLKNKAIQNMSRQLINVTKTPPVIIKTSNSNVDVDVEASHTRRPRQTSMEKMDNKLKETLKMVIKKQAKKQVKIGKNPISATIPDTDSDNKIKDALKESLKHMLFSKIKECESGKYKQPYYMSKTDILTVLKQNPKLSKKFLSTASKMSKTELCQKILSYNK
jgi:hypothetical protein